MIFTDEKGKIRWRFIFLRIAVIVGSVAVLLFFMPRQNGPSYDYEIGKPWIYGSLIASYDFGILKSEETLKRERDSVLNNFEPYFNMNRDVSKRAVNRFIADHKAGIPGLPKSYIYSIARVMREAYDIGIIDQTHMAQLQNEHTKRIRMVEDKVAVSLAVDSLHSTLTAYESLYPEGITQEQRAILQRCNLNNYIEPNIFFDEHRTSSARNDLVDHISLSSGVVYKGQKIIDRGEIVNGQTYNVLESLKKEDQRRSDDKLDKLLTLGGQMLYMLLLLTLFMIYLILFRKDYFESMQPILMMYSLMVIFSVAVALMMEHNFFNIYIIPFCIVPIFVRVFMDSRTAFFVHVIMVFLSAIAVKYQYEFVVVQLLAGIVAIYSVRELTRRSQIIQSALLVSLTSMLVYLCFDLMNDDTLSKLNETMYVYFAVNGTLLLFTYPLMYLVERLFGYTSSITLVELSNANNEVLRKMSEVAPGTFQHSIQVSNLAAEIANRIGAKSQLVRTGALYHDIGKMANPAFFTENHAASNPHASLSAPESAQIIVNHVAEGLRLAEKYDLPAIIRDFIATHHGMGMAKYFYVTYKNQHPDEEVDTLPFSYPGPNPFTAEQACLVMADAVEAAARSLTEYTEENISNIVNKIIDQQLADGLYKECPITFRDLNLAKQVLIDKLKTMYHTRISYPELKNNATVGQ